MRTDSVAARVLLKEPYLALRINNYVFRETVYGIVKRLCFLIDHMERKRRELKLKVARARILDVGCGTGVNVTIPLANLGYSVVGLDTDRHTVERAQQIAGGISNIEFRIAKLEKCHFPEPFHVIICSEVLEHLREPQVLVSQMRNALHDAGLLLVTVPNGYGYFEWEALWERCFPRIGVLIDRLQHKLVRRLGQKELRLRHEKEWQPEHYQLAWTTLTSAQDHCHRFTSRRIKQILTSQRFEIIEFRNRTFLAGNLLNSAVRDWDRFLRWNCEIADKLPPWMCSGWMIAARPGPCKSGSL